MSRPQPARWATRCSSSPRSPVPLRVAPALTELLIDRPITNSHSGARGTHTTMRIKITIVIAVACCSLGIQRAEASPFDQLVSLLTDSDSGLAAIKRHIAAIEAKLA